ncbi:tRNA pseudouridine(55) synthase TruB [bacterium]|nr:tRNA pseudouridine(55) synthase TruB [bacterium]
MVKKVLIFGKFDILHPGHIKLIKEAQKLGEVTAVLESDKIIKSLHHSQVFYNQKIRQKNLENFGLNIHVRKENTAQEILDNFCPDVLCLGEDQHFLQKMFADIDGSRVETIQLSQPTLFKSSRLKTILEDNQAGIYLLDKPKGVNSFKSVSILRKVLDIKKVGFAGTLDPLASGLLIMGTGKATRLLDWFHLLPKIYQADILFGQTSNTYDLEGKVNINKQVKAFDKKYLENIIVKFIGRQDQVAPIFSAKKIDGQKLHKLARQGKEVKAPSKEIEIYDLKIKKFKYPNLMLEVSCSAGTYIRSLAHDLGEVSGQGALLANLRRTRIGDFSVEQAIIFEKIKLMTLKKYYISPKEIISSLNQHFYR